MNAAGVTPITPLTVGMAMPEVDGNLLIYRNEHVVLPKVVGFVRQGKSVWFFVESDFRHAIHFDAEQEADHAVFLLRDYFRYDRR